jgi:hypothetical protein
MTEAAAAATDSSKGSRIFMASPIGARLHKNPPRC